MLKHETLAKLGFEQNMMVPADSQSVSSKSSGTYALELQRPKAIDYLQKGVNESKESVRDFIENARKILISQIAINDKREETERLNEYIIMEREKLEEARKTFDEDQDKFKKYMSDLTEKAEKTENEVKKLVVEKGNKATEIASIEQEIQDNKSEIKKIEEKLTLYK